MIWMSFIKRLCVYLFVILLSLNIILIPKVYANDNDIPNIASPSALLMDLKSGKILTRQPLVIMLLCLYLMDMLLLTYKLGKN